MSDLAAGLISASMIILAVVFSVVEYLSSASRRELIDLLTRRTEQHEDESNN
jgi:hypothetical protein